MIHGETFDKMRWLALSAGNLLEDEAMQRGDTVVLIRDPTYAAFDKEGTIDDIKISQVLVQVGKQFWSVVDRQVGYNPDPTHWSDYQKRQFDWLVSTRMGELLGVTAFAPGEPIVVVKGASPAAWFKGNYLGLYEAHPRTWHRSHVNVAFNNTIVGEWQARVVSATEMGYPHPHKDGLTLRQTALFKNLLKAYYDAFNLTYEPIYEPRKDAKADQSGI